MAAQAAGLDPSERIFTELRNKNDEVKQRAANELRDLVNLLSRGRRMTVHLEWQQLTSNHRMVT